MSKRLLLALITLSSFALPAAWPAQAQSYPFPLPIPIDPQTLIDDILDIADTVDQETLKATELSESQELAIAKALMPKVEKSLKKINYTRLNLQGVFKKILPHVKRKNVSYQVFAIQDSQVNAFTIIGGHIYVFKGLLDKIQNEDQLAMVLGHEISHNELKHCIHQVQYGVIATEIDPVLGELVQLAYNLYRMPFSKKQEFAADKNGLTLAVQAGYNRQKAINFFDILDQVERKAEVNQSPVNDFIASHAPASERKQRLLSGL